MGDVTAPMKDDEERPVPTAWRPVFESIVEAIARGTVETAAELPRVDQIDPETAQQIRDAIKDYGDDLSDGVTLLPLPDEAWETCIAAWQGDSWEVLIDLWSQEEGHSDLVLRAKVRDDGDEWRVAIGMVYVP